MGKQRARCGAGKCRGHAARNTVIALSIVGLFLTLVVVSQPGVSFPLSMSYTIGNENWECQTTLYSGSVAGQYYKIPSQVTTLPSYVMGVPTSSNLQIDPDYVAGTVEVYVGMEHATAPATGPQPKVIMSLTQVIPTDSTGQPLSTPTPAKEWDDTTGTTKVHQYLYYFYFEAEMKTESGKCARPFGYGYPGDWIKNSYCGVLYEYELVPVVMQVSVDLESIYQNASFQSNFADARVTYVKNGYIPSTINVNSFETSYDYGAYAYNDFDISNKLNPTYEVTGGVSDTHAILTLSASLQSGMIMDHEGNAIYGIEQPVNVYTIYGVLFSVQVTRPLTQAPRPPEAGRIQIIDYLIAVMHNPNDPAFWLIIVVVLVVVYLVIPKKKVGQAVQAHFHIGGRSKGGGTAS